MGLTIHTLMSMNNHAFAWKGMGCYREAFWLVQACYQHQRRVFAQITLVHGPHHGL